MKHYYFLIIQMSILFCVSCVPENDENHHYYIIFNNNTGKDLYVLDSSSYPDTLGYFVSRFADYPIDNYFINREYCKVTANSHNNEVLRLPWERTYERAFYGHEGIPKDYKNDTMMVFVWDAEIYNKLTLHDRVKDSILLQDAFRVRYDLSYQDLQRLNWTLSYPPTENMKTIKMWPNFFQ
ncbi:MAG: hypothetical protein J5957_01450 [Prevotella sp.]|nr:hypothetical protein [Prevotella sp.]